MSMGAPVAARSPRPVSAWGAAALRRLTVGRLNILEDDRR
jgi:hypothetical protein